ncbi:MAG TPA: phosphotransferase, partial [Polyangiales bacterium]|nr:phosphotransferase [Polyangiales bacterium]
DGKSFARDDAGEVYRAYAFVERAHALTGTAQPAHAREAGRAFAEFQLALADLPAPPLVEVLPGFHDTRARLARLERAVAADSCGRAADAAPDIAFTRERATLADAFSQAAARGELVLRVAHNDTKLDNLLFDDASGHALCVVDLDTVMPGFWAHDFGDLARSLLSGQEQHDLALLAALCEGYLGVVGTQLSAAERSWLAEAPRLIALELGTRFLTDHLEGDGYFAVQQPGQNLQRARQQLANVLALERYAGELRRMVR